MAQLEEIKIFLGSPGDVQTERRYVEQVVDELNRTVAADKKVFLRLVSSSNVFPGYGKDGQTIINQQIGNMSEYDLFIGIMWKRIGTPTPRAKSGTAEELGRAVQAFNRRQKPKIWFYFRTSAPPTKTQAEAKQLIEVLAFKDKFRKRSLFREYKTTAIFRDLLREHLTLWLNARKKKVRKASSNPSTRSTGKKSNVSKPPATRNQGKPPVASTSKQKTSVSKSPPTKAHQPPQKRRARSVKSPNNWIMLDGMFVKTESNTHQTDNSVLLKISTKDIGQIADLKRLAPQATYNQRQVSFADLHEAGTMRVSSATPEIVGSKSSFNITLEKAQRSQNTVSSIEMGYQGYTADKIAELRARQILLGESLPSEIIRFLLPTKVQRADGNSLTIESEVFSELWQRLATRQSLFLPKAWLWATYCLKTSRIIEDILELELGPIKSKVMPIRFKGRRKEYYSQKTVNINVVGNCVIKT